MYVVLLALLEGSVSQEEYLVYNNIKIKFVKIPRYVYGFIYKHKDCFLIAINQSLSDKKKKETILHEFAHFELHHFEKEVFEFKIENLEDEADRLVQFLLEKE